MAKRPSTALDLLSSSAPPVIEAFVESAYERMEAFAAAGDVTALAEGISSVDRALDRIHFLRTEAGRRAYNLLPDEQYKYRGEQRTRKGMWNHEGRLLMEPRMSGGGWRGFDYPAVLKRVAHRAWGLNSRVVNAEGEIVGTIEDVVKELCACVSFSGVKANYEKNTGLAKWGIERQDIGEYEDPRRDVRVQRGSES